MQELHDFVRNHTKIRRPGQESPWVVGALDTIPTADMVFFEVRAEGDPDPKVFRQLITKNFKGDFGDLNPLDGQEHSYLEVGGWIGDQGVALQFMGLGVILGLWGLMTPKMLDLPDDLVQQMVGMGYVSIIPARNGH